MMMMMMANDNFNNYTMTITTEERIKINVKYLAWLYAKSKEKKKQHKDVFGTERAIALVIRDAGGEEALKELFLKEQDEKIIDELVSSNPTIAETLGQL
jgi:phosphopantothenoylcysteine synthetase/decarboxylase